MMRLLLGTAHALLSAGQIRSPPHELVLLHDGADPTALHAAAQRHPAGELIVQRPGPEPLPVRLPPRVSAVAAMLFGVLPRRCAVQQGPFWAHIERPGTRQRKRRRDLRR